MALPQQLPGISVVPQAPQIDPRLLAPDAASTLLSAQAGIHLGTELSGLQNLQGKLELEKAEIAAKKAQNEYQRQAAEHAVTTLPQMVEQQVAAAKASIAQNNASVPTYAPLANATIANADASAASSQYSLAQAKAGLDAGIPQFTTDAAKGQLQNQILSNAAARDFSSLSPQEKDRQMALGKTAGELGAESLLPTDVRQARKSVMFDLPLAKQRQEIAQTNAASMAQKLRLPVENITNSDGTYNYDLIQKKWDAAKISDPLTVFGDMPGFKEGFTKAKDLRQTQLFLDKVPELLKDSGDPSTLQKALDDFRDTKGASIFKAALGAAAGSNVDPKTAARSALIDIIDMKLGGALSSSGESKTLKNSLQVQSKDSNESILAVVNRYRSSVDQAYNSAKEGLPPEAFKNVDDGSVFTPRSIGAAAKSRIPPASTSPASSTSPLAGQTGKEGEVRSTPQGTYVFVVLPDGRSGWKRQ